MKHAYEIVASFHHHESLSVHTMLNLLQKFRSRLEALSPNLRDWLLAGETKEEALMYEVFKNGEPTTAALAVLETNLKGKHDPRIVTIWNGLDGHEGASLRFIGRPGEYSSLVTFVGRPKSFSSDWQAIVQVMKAGVAIWHPDYITLESNGFYDHRTFEDRPGVGWMLYLPKILSSREVPEARALGGVRDFV